jgi:hypothetical protein
MARLRAIYSTAARIWCKLMHPEPMWPINGFYRCRTCHRLYPVPWNSPERTSAEMPAQAALRPYPRSAPDQLRPAA